MSDYNRCTMSSGHDQERGRNYHLVALGLAVVASTVTADIASFVGHLQVARLILFDLARLFAAMVALLASTAIKKDHHMKVLTYDLLIVQELA